MKLCSACLLGIKCRYNGKDSLNKKVLELAKKEILIPVCPEQLGGFPTPREPAERKGSKVFTKSGKNVTKKFQKGAKETLKIAELFNVKVAIFKERSPSCGVNYIYDGSFAGKTIRKEGLATKLLKKHGIKVMSDEELK